MMGFTARQAQTLAFITSRIEEAGVAPSFEEMRDHLGIASKEGVHRILTALEERGAIRRRRHRARAIELLPTSAALRGCSDAALLAECERRGLR